MSIISGPAVDVPRVPLALQAIRTGGRGDEVKLCWHTAGLTDTAGFPSSRKLALLPDSECPAVCAIVLAVRMRCPCITDNYCKHV